MIKFSKTATMSFDLKRRNAKLFKILQHSRLYKIRGKSFNK